MTDADQLQRQARDILNEPRFHERRTPGPFRGVFRQLGEWLEPALAPIGRFFLRLFRVVADWWETPETRVVLVLAVVLLAIVLATAVIRRRSAVSIAGGGPGGGGKDEDPAALERAADRAEAEGRFGDAVRLRFQAGVVRLQRDGKVRRGKSTPTRAIARQLKIAEFDRLGQTFDAVAYGGRDASADDAAEAKREWQRVLVEAGRRE